jgi:hypothetical protein
LTNAEGSDLLTNQIAGSTAIAFAVLHAGFFIASLVVIPILAPGVRIPNPFGSDEAGLTFLLNNTEAIRVSSCLQLVPAVCLAALGTMMTSRQKLHKSASAPLGVGLVGSVGAAVMLASAALCSWALASPGAIDPGSAFRTLQFLPFLMGGPGWAGFFALFLAGVVGSGVSVLPKWAVWTGCLLSVISALAMFVMLTITVSVCLPISRFLGFVWLILVAIQLRGQVANRNAAPNV